jgi:restriction system protein
MGIPDFQSLMLPLLRIAEDGQRHTLSEARERLADQFELTAEQREELLPSGRQARFGNRVAWAKVYLQQAGLLGAPRRGPFEITKRGLELLKSPPARIDIRYLDQFPEFAAFRAHEEDDEPATRTPETPEEALEAAYANIRSNLASQLLDRIRQASAKFFEKLVVQVLVGMGYGGTDKEAARVVGRAGDEGIDGVINEDHLGLDVIYVQAKKWDDGVVGRPELQKFVGALHGKRARKGVFITSGRFSGEAVEYVERIEPRVVSIDGTRLAELMIDFNVGGLGSVLGIDNYRLAFHLLTHGANTTTGVSRGDLPRHEPWRPR